MSIAKESILEILETELAQVPGYVNLTDTLGDLGADVSDVYRIYDAIEECFDVEMPDYNSGEVESIQQIIDYVEANAF